MSHNNTASHIYTSGAATRRTSNAASLETQRSTSDVVPEKEDKELSPMNTTNDMNSNAIELQIRLVSGDKFTVQAHIHDLVGEVKQRIIAQRHYAHKQLKLIHSGRVLSDQHTLHQARITHDTILHCAVSDLPNSNSNTTTSTTSASTPHDEQQLRGFDRLRAMGLSAEEVHAIRTQFALAHAANYTNTTAHNNTGPINTDPAVLGSETLLQLEENWIEHELSPEDRQVAAAHAIEHRQREGSGVQLFGGMVTGFVLGLLALCWMWDTSLTRQGKFGLLTGLALNVLFGLIRLSSL